MSWPSGDLISASDPRAAALEVVLPEYHETLRPTYAVPDVPLPDGRGSPWLMLIEVLPTGTPLDEIVTANERRWQATPQARFERLLRETRVPIGLLCNRTHLRLVYAPRGETAGHLTFLVQAMSETAGRPVFAALLMLLSAERLFALPDKQRLPAILADKRYPFLEGGGAAIPLVADGVLFRVLQNLLVLDGERISYRSLDVEQIGSVYETMMGFRLEKATGRSLAVKPIKSHGAPVTIDLEKLLRVPGKERGKWLKEKTDQGVTGAALNALKAAATPEDVAAALERKIARALTPNIVPPGSMILQPSDERRRSGSHYTPRSLTEPIVRKALEPVLKQFGEQPPAPQLLALKICDPAMGCGAFLVEACRQLGDALLKAWNVHGGMLKVPDDETPELLAQRLIAQRCLYGVDKNPMAVDLAKMSLWLATLAKDHALRCGDSLVGLTRQQIADFNWKKTAQRVFGQERIEERIQAATRVRQEILDAGDDIAFALKQQKLALAEVSLNLVRFAGNLVVSAFFAADNERKRQAKRDDLLAQVTEYLNTGNMNLRPRVEEKGIAPFHWEIEFPEVFAEPRSLGSGFDCLVGNPPFAGKNTIIDGHPDGYLDWLKSIHPEAHGNADLVAHFFRRAFNLLRPGGTFGLIATNTISQGDTRSTGLRWICTHGGTIYTALRRMKWPGQAAVVVSVVHVCRAATVRERVLLDGKPVPRITAYLFHAGGHDKPATLKANANKSFQGSIVLGMGFTFDDTDKNGVASPLSEMQRLIAKDARNAERIFPYIGGEEVNDSPTHAHHRYVINLGEMTEKEARTWPDLLSIVEAKVKPERMVLRNTTDGIRLKEKWWLFARVRPELAAAIRGLERVLVCSRIGNAFAFTFLKTGTVFNEKIVVFPSTSFSFF